MSFWEWVTRVLNDEAERVKHESKILDRILAVLEAERKSEAECSHRIQLKVENGWVCQQCKQAMKGKK